MSTPIIQAEALTKRYGSSRGIESLDFDVREGEVFGFLGPNGAGKSTTMRLLLDFIRPTSGRATLFGRDTRGGGGAHARIGYLPGELGLADRMTAGEHLRFLGNLRGGVEWSRVEALAERFALDLDRPQQALSRGNKQKVGIVQAFMHDPELLILDEPTSGLDPLMQQTFNELVRETRARGKTVFLSSHILPEVEALCDRVGIIREGRLMMVEDMATVKARAVRRVEATFAAPPDASLVETIPHVTDVEVHGNVLSCKVTGAVGGVVRVLADMGVEDLVTREPNLEELFLGYYNGGPDA